VAVSRPRPRILGLRPGKGMAAVNWAGPKSFWAGKMMFGPNLFDIFFSGKLRNGYWAA